MLFVKHFVLFVVLHFNSCILIDSDQLNLSPLMQRFESYLVANPENRCCFSSSFFFILQVARMSTIVVGIMNRL